MARRLWPPPCQRRSSGESPCHSKLTHTLVVLRHTVVEVAHHVVPRTSRVPEKKLRHNYSSHATCYQHFSELEHLYRQNKWRYPVDLMADYLEKTTSGWRDKTSSVNGTSFLSVSPLRAKKSNLAIAFVPPQVHRPGH